jgi:hypothetical protein
MRPTNVQTSTMSELVSFRADDGSSGRAERLAKELGKQPAYAGIGFTKSRVYSMALARGIASLEQELGVSTPKKRGKK